MDLIVTLRLGYDRPSNCASTIKINNAENGLRVLFATLWVLLCQIVISHVNKMRKNWSYLGWGEALKATKYTSRKPKLNWHDEMTSGNEK